MGRWLREIPELIDLYHNIIMIIIILKISCYITNKYNVYLLIKINGKLESV